MTTYSAYRKSNIPWLEKIPSHWVTQRAKFIFNRHKRPVRNGDEIITCFRDGTVTLRKNRRETGFTNAIKEFGYQGIRRGDLVVHQMDAFAGSIGVSDSDGKATPVLSVCTMRDKNLSTWYYAYLLRVMSKTDFIQSLSRGIRERSTAFGYDIMGNLWLPIPPAEEQEAIVEYLDKATAEIDKAIEAKERIIAALEERRKIIITEAVTRGINPDVPLRDSGIDWLGQIPTHWETIRIKYLLKEEKARSKKGLEEPLSMSQRKGLIPTKDMGTIPNLAASYIDAKLVSKGNLVFNKLKAHLGVFNVSEYDGLVSPDYAVYSSTGKSNLKFLEYIFKTHNCINEFKKLITGVGAGLFRLYTGDLYSIYIAVPPIDEQDQICSHIISKTKELSNAIDICEKSIELLRERKNIIINEAVTGKVKVI